MNIVQKELFFYQKINKNPFAVVKQFIQAIILNQMQMVSRKMAGRLVVPAFGLQMGNHWKPIRSYKWNSWHCFPSVPSVEVMTCDTVPKRAMASWYVVDTSHENKHQVGVGKSTSETTNKAYSTKKDGGKNLQRPYKEGTTREGHQRSGISIRYIFHWFSNIPFLEHDHATWTMQLIIIQLMRVRKVAF